jgi:hypothetical protein
MSNIIVKAFLAYIEKNPEIVEKLVEALLTKLIEDLTHKQDSK